MDIWIYGLTLRLLSSFYGRLLNDLQAEEIKLKHGTIDDYVSLFPKISVKDSPSPTHKVTY
jgi:hypothetical protein